MKKYLILITLLFLLSSCASKKPKIVGSSTNPTEKSSDYNSVEDINEYSKNKKYGLYGKFPVKVGEMKVENQRRYLASLAGPNGEELEFHRRGSCCGYKSENAVFGGALVDVYEVKYKGLKEPILIYISFYDSEKLYIPLGFIKRKI
jgi:hypothetical protein